MVILELVGGSILSGVSSLERICRFSGGVYVAFSILSSLSWRLVLMNSYNLQKEATRVCRRRRRRRPGRAFWDGFLDAIDGPEDLDGLEWSWSWLWSLAALVALADD